MSESIEQNHPALSRRQFLTGAMLIGGALVLDACSAKPQHSSVPKPTDPLDFSHLPDGRFADKLWRYELDPRVAGYNHEAQTYTDTQAIMTKGHLAIEAIKTANGYKSSRIDTKGLFNFTHGTVTAVAKLPEGVGTWPAIWMLPDATETPRILTKHGIEGAQADPNDPTYYAWGGEIDWLETIGANNNPVNNTPAVHTHESITTGVDGGISPFVLPVPDGQKRFHEYGLHKETGLLQFTLDGKVIHEVTRKDGDTLAEWPFDDYRYYLIANLAMGGSWGGRMNKEFPPYGIDDSKGPWKFEIAEMHYQPK
jgi:beta-glucanase (GH16 family)